MADLLYAIVALVEVTLLIVGGFVLGKALHHLLAWLANFVTSRTGTTLDDLVLKAIGRPLEAATILAVTYFLSAYLSNLGEVRGLLSEYSLAILVLLGAYLLSEVVGAVLHWYYTEGREKTQLKMDVTLLPFIRNLTSILILFFGITASLGIIGVDISGILTVTSVAMLVLGLASQETLANIFAGLALQLDRPFVYGDYLKFTSGEVVRLRKIGLRSTRLQDLNGNIMIISNSEFAKERLLNLSRPTPEFRASVKIDLPLGTDMEKFERQLAEKMQGAKIEGLQNPACTFAIDKIGKDTVTVSVRFWVADPASYAKTQEFMQRSVLELVVKKEKAAASASRQNGEAMRKKNPKDPKNSPRA